MLLPLDVPESTDHLAIATRLALAAKFFPSINTKIILEEITDWPQHIAASVKEFELTESDYAALAAFSCLRNWRQLSDSEILKAHHLDANNKLPFSLASKLRDSMAVTFPMFEKTWIHKIRAKLAALELLSSSDPILGIPLLLHQAVYYSGAKEIVKYLHVNQALTRSRSPEARKSGAENLDNYVHAIKTLKVALFSTISFFNSCSKNKT